MLLPSQQTVDEIFQAVHLSLIDNSVRCEPRLLAQSQSDLPLYHQDGKLEGSLHPGHQKMTKTTDGVKICQWSMHLYDSEVKFFPTSFVHKSFMFYNYFFKFKELNDFCIYHPYLEQLHFFLQNDREEDQHLFELKNWKLPLLKILVHSYDRLAQSNIL